MNGTRRLSAVLIITSISCVLSTCLAFAVERGFVEDFDSKQYCDTLNTTALWDTVAGELKLPPFVLTYAGSYSTPGAAYDVAISGDYAYVTESVTDLLVLDISDPTTPVFAGSYVTSGGATGIVVCGDYAYLAVGDFGLTIIDITDPVNPAYVGNYDTPGYARGVFVAGDHAYVADGDSGLAVIDISDPTVPALAGGYDTPGESRAVAVAGDYAYVADGFGSGLQVIDISDPTTPVYAGSSIFAANTRDVAVAGDYAFFASGTDGLRVSDISDPTNPVPAGDYNTPGISRYIAVAGDFAYIGDDVAGIQVIDISDPENPAYHGGYDTPGNAYGIAVGGDYAYVGNYLSGLQVIYVADPMLPGHIGDYATGTNYGVTVDGDYAFVANSLAGLRVMDIADPTAPVPLGAYDTPGKAYGVAVTGDFAYIADGDSGLQVVDIFDPTLPVLAGSYDMPGTAWGVAVSGDYVYVADGTFGIQVVDIGDPTTPVLLGSYDTPDIARNVVVAGDYAYVGDRYSGLQVFDVSDPTTPKPAGSCDTPGFVWGVAISGDYAYLGDGLSGLQVVDISNPTAPSIAGTYDTPGSALGVAVAGDFVYVGDGSSGLHAISIADPTSPVLVGSYDTPGTAYGVAVDGDNAYLADFLDFQVIQVYQRAVNLVLDKAQSLVVNTLRENIVRGKITDTPDGPFSWELSADNGANWVPVSSDGTWHRIIAPGDSVVWRSSLVYVLPPINPTTSVEIEWLYDFALIDSIVDVPDDQGGWARLHFTRSGDDFADDIHNPIAGYNIHRRIDDPALIQHVLADGKPISLEPKQHKISAGGAELEPFVTSRGFSRMLGLDGSYYVVTADPALSAPPGVWEIVAVAFAQQQDQYVCLVSTVGDSASTIPYSVYYVSAHTTTPSVYYSSFPDSGYSVDNIAPGVPEGFTVAYNTGSGNHLSWDPSVDLDFQYFRIYRGDDPGFTPAPGNLVHATADVQWNDPEYDGWDVHYKITAVDHVGNESDAASVGTVSGVTEPRIPTTFALRQNVPNPFNPTTLIRYDVPVGGGKVTLRIYDVRGRLVRTLVDALQSPGEKWVVWYGRDNRGAGVATGVYFYRMTGPGYEMTKKMVLVR
jgi:hypothetical protein